VVTDPKTGERRDALDQRWTSVLSQLGRIPLILPNDSKTVENLLDRNDPTALILTGGNDLAAYGGDAPERDAAEAAAIAWFRQKKRPILGVCRGLQHLTHLLGGTLRKIDGHAGTRHAVKAGAASREVNSYHTWAIDALPPGCEATATAADGSVEAWRHRSEPITAIMWHPEREDPVTDVDLALLRDTLTMAQ
ncbi:MAG: gamma-glutamyl-gamma-aminobutyrate hydrolase family protein, partial [Rhodobacteraceae bacterium]|nr:gamma-glutamyl-gamma-aminobutyrate hydrolase family protein [Paracoccaceae bacterium]